LSKPNLIQLAKQDPDLAGGYGSLRSWRSICGDGNLKDGSECSAQLREYLRDQVARVRCRPDGEAATGYMEG
jgi:hypothetical protein